MKLHLSCFLKFQPKTRVGLELDCRHLQICIRQRLVKSVNTTSVMFFLIKKLFLKQVFFLPMLQGVCRSLSIVAMEGNGSTLLNFNI